MLLFVLCAVCCVLCAVCCIHYAVCCAVCLGDCTLRLGRVALLRLLSGVALLRLGRVALLRLGRVACEDTDQRGRPYALVCVCVWSYPAARDRPRVAGPVSLTFRMLSLGI